MVKSRADNSGQNGFQFQTVAAISLLLDYLYDFKQVKNEHEIEDVVLILSDETYILAQAKTSHDNEESNNALQYLKKGLLTLNEASKEHDLHKLIYITNIRTMLGASTIEDDFVIGETIWFSEMDGRNRDILTKYAPANFDFDSFGVQFLKYQGEDKEKWILNKMKTVFSDSVYLNGLRYKEVYKTWLLYLLQNASEKNPLLFCDKDKMIWGMIIHRINGVESDISNESENDYSEVDNQYSMDDHTPNPLVLVTKQ